MHSSHRATPDLLRGLLACGNEVAAQEAGTVRVKIATLILNLSKEAEFCHRHCEKRSDEAIQISFVRPYFLDCHAPCRCSQ